MSPGGSGHLDMTLIERGGAIQSDAPEGIGIFVNYIILGSILICALKGGEGPSRSLFQVLYCDCESLRRIVDPCGCCGQIWCVGTCAVRQGNRLN